MTQIPWTAIFEQHNTSRENEYFAREFYGSIEHNKMLEEARSFAAARGGNITTVCIIKGSHSGGFYASR
jgi:hypothetical protein